MKRGGPIPRRTPLRSSAPSPRDAKPKTKPGIYAGVNKARELVRTRSGGFCEIHMVGCFNLATDWHHRKLRSQGGRWEAVNGLHACRFCHEAVTNTRGHRKEYEANGWLVPRSGDPAAVEVLLWHQGRQDWFLLLPDGSVDLAPWPEGRPEHPDELDLPRRSSEIDGAA